MTEVKTERRKLIYANILLFFLFSFLGWVLEKLWFYFCYGVNADRGFLTLPFCTIYGFSILFLRAALGRPLKYDPPFPLNLLQIVCYIALCALVATLAEAVTGLFFERVFSLRLWVYEWPYSAVHGYICLPMSIAWGFMIAFAISLIWLPLEKLLLRAPHAVLGFSSGVLLLAVTLDFFLTAFL